MEIARFEKVSSGQFDADWRDTFGSSSSPFDAIRLPRRATTGSAGYDFYSPTDFTLKPGETIKLPTGIRVYIQEGWFLMIVPRSGLGFKYRLRLDNTVGIIDADYYRAENEGHILLKLTNCGDQTLSISAGQAVVQGIFLPFGLAEGDDATGIRTSGFGSTDT